MKKLIAVILVCVFLLPCGCGTMLQPTGQQGGTTATGQPQPQDPLDQYSGQVK